MGLRSISGAMTALAVSVLPAIAAADPVFTPLHWFKYDQPGQGLINGAPAIGPDGTVYIASVTAYGTVYRLTPPTSGNGLWPLKILYNFNGDDGYGPYGRLLLTKSGTLFGTTEGTDGNYGNVYELTPPSAAGKPWDFSIDYQFTGEKPDDGQPYGGVIMDEKGRLIGAAQLGGPKGYGTIFMLTPPAKAGARWTKTVLHNFNIYDGMNPQGELVQDTDGTLYGVTKAGGKNYYGTIFELTPPATDGGKWGFKKLYDFTGRTDNGFPSTALAFNPKHTALYGVAQPAVTGETGIVFSIAKPAAGKTKWPFTIIHAFQSNGTDGRGDTGTDILISAPVVDKAGNLYGATPEGGSGTEGVVYKLTPPAKAGGLWGETILHAFKGKDGGEPSAISMSADGTLYGATNYGGPGASGGAGGVYSLKP